MPDCTCGQGIGLHVAPCPLAHFQGTEPPALPPEAECVWCGDPCGTDVQLVKAAHVGCHETELAAYRKAIAEEGELRRRALAAEAERDALREMYDDRRERLGLAERMRPVVEAACRWRDSRMPAYGLLQSRSDLARAVDAYREDADHGI